MDCVWTKKHCLHTHACTHTHTHTHACMHTHTHTHTQWKNDYYTVLQYDKHVKLQWVDVVKVWFRIWTNAYGKEVGMSVKAGLTAEDVYGKKTKNSWERGQNCKLPDAWGMISHVRASFSKDWMGNAAKSVTLWASRQNGLLMPWLIVAYALCTMLADHPNTQSIVQTACLCLRCQPPWSLLLLPGVFKPSCSTPFTLFLCVVSVYWPFQLYFIPKTLHNTSVFSSLLTAYFYLTGHSPAFIYNTTLLYIVLLALCGHIQTQLHPVSGDGILVAEVPRGVQHASSARTSPRWVVGLARPNQLAGHALP